MGNSSGRRSAEKADEETIERKSSKKQPKLEEFMVNGESQSEESNQRPTDTEYHLHTSCYIAGGKTLNSSDLPSPPALQPEPFTPPRRHCLTPTPFSPSPTSSGSSWTTIEEKFYGPNDPTFTFVDREDEMDFLCEDFESPRALMSCGHAVTPTSLTNWCLQQLDEGRTRFVCGQTSCNVEWSYEEVCRMALLTPQEKRYFEKTLKTNADKRNTKACPGCSSPVVRSDQSNLRVRCSVCSVTNRRIYDFCWQCMREWRGPDSRPDHCGNDDCRKESLKTLQTCPDAVFELEDGDVSCPSMRACPTCGIMLQHDTEGCKNATCPQCKKEFCFLCLKSTRRCLKTSDYYIQCSCRVAPRQTSIPVWQK